MVLFSDWSTTSSSTKFHPISPPPLAIEPEGSLRAREPHSQSLSLSGSSSPPSQQRAVVVMVEIDEEGRTREVGGRGSLL